MTNLIGQSFGRYHILEQLGEGGMAVVYKAFDTSLERDVAIKVILPYREHTGPFLKRFALEARALAKLAHPNILRIFDYGQHEGQPYLVMEYVTGGTLAQNLNGKQIPWLPASQLLARVARALEAAHAQGIIHRDVKPSNILLANGREPLLSDFGIAKMIEEDAPTSGLTATGAGIGTPEYMAPEQGFGRADARADVYALGVIFYEMVAGRRPYQADTPMAIMLKKNTEPLPRPSEFVRDLPPAVENVLIKALARDPENRYPTMAAFANALEALANPKSATFTLRDTLVESTLTPDESVLPATSGTRVGSKGWIPWVVGAGLLSACCVMIAGVIVWWGMVPPAKSVPTEAPSLTAPPTLAPTIVTDAPVFLPTPTPVPFILSDTPVPFLPPTFTPTPVRSSGGTWIAFNSKMSGAAEIYLVDVYGDNLTRLTDNSVHDQYPSWSPDGLYLAYQTNAGEDYELAIINISSRSVRTLTSNECNDWSPSWSPDGEWLAYYSDCGGERNIYKIRIDGSERQQLTFGSGAYSWFPSWSPDGRKITFSSNRNGVYQIFVMNADGSNQRTLANGCVSYFSPDGSQILYGVYCTDTDDLWLMNSDGSDQHPITNGCECKNATWSPDGTRIVFQVSSAGQDGPFAIYILSFDNPKKSDWIMVTNYDINGGSPVWQP